MRTEPVAETSGTRRSATKRSPTPLRPPMIRLKIGGAPFASSTRWAMRVVAMAVSGAWCDGFQIIESPQTAATMAFQAQTATGKLKAVMMPTTPSGCHCSYMRCIGRSECMERP